MALNEFLTFAADEDANVLPQEDYEALGARADGFPRGLLPSAQINKALRQSAVMSSALAKAVSDALDVDVVDDGDRDALAAQIADAIVAIAQAVPGGYVHKSGDEMTGALGVVEGSAEEPGLYVGAEDTGLFSDGAGHIGVSVGAVARAEFGSDAVMKLRASGEPGQYTLANSGLIIVNAAGVELMRVRATDPDENNFNSGNLYVGFETGLAQPADNVTAGYYNHGFGYRALYSITTGDENNFFGYYAGYSVTTGDFNIGYGGSSLAGTTTGSRNVGIGQRAGMTGTPANANVSGSRNTWIGDEAGPGTTDQLDNATAIGASALNTASNQIVLGNEFVTETILRGTVIVDGVELGSAAFLDGSLLAPLASPAFTDDPTAPTQEPGDSSTKLATTAFVAAAVAAAIGLIGFTDAENTGLGIGAGDSLAGGQYNVTIGNNAGTALTTGSRNVVVGNEALANGVFVNNSVAIGWAALNASTSSNGQNVAVGYYAMGLSVGGTRNTAVGGGGPLSSIISGNDCTSIGYGSLASNTASEITAVGAFALDNNSSGIRNTAVGYNALTASSTAGGNTAMGWGALQTTSIGGNNTAIGESALLLCTGGANTAIGAIAGNFIVAGNNNTLIGYDADVNSSTALNRIVIGASAAGTADNSVFIGNGNVHDLYLGGTKILGARSTGWTAPTATQSKAGFGNGASSTQIEQTLSAVVNAMIDHGMLGS